MITGKENNTVYFSQKLQEGEFASTFERIEQILKKYKINYKLLSNTKDIWCRDYMPIQVDEETFIQFRYEPSYLKDELNLQSNPKEVLVSNRITAEFSNINLDGGNVVNSKNKVILTSRVFKENPQLSSTEIEKELTRLFKSDVYFVRDITSDMTGHIDGHLRFIDSQTILVNELENEYKYWKDSFYEMTKSANLDFVEIPWFEHKDKNHPYSAIGGYVNYLEIGNLILFPVFEVSGNKDEEAIKIMESVFPDRKIEPINVNEIGKHGGLLNCTTWTIQEKPPQHAV
jgi:agmatine deiminase